jgi:hypothetical protein
VGETDPLRRSRRNQIYHDSVNAARLADVVITSTDVLRALYESAGIEQIEVLENYLLHGTANRRTRKHAGFVIGWLRASSMPETRARWRPPTRSLGYSWIIRTCTYIALAPIAETAFNAARSNIKVKEYAASCIPRLASSRGPYVDLGEKQGGRLVDDDGWYEAIGAMVRDRRARRRLARAGRSWAKAQTIDAVADRYEELFTKAASRSTRTLTAAVR